MNNPIMCDKCKSRPAVFHKKIIVNGQARETHLCSECRTNESGFLGDILGLDSLFNPTSFIKEIDIGDNEPKCSKCGFTYSNYEKTGMLGCPYCYESFEQYLEPSIRKIQKDIKHVGKNPLVILSDEEKEYNKLLAAREEAVKNENFVLAAEINEKMKKLKEGK